MKKDFFLWSGVGERKVRRSRHKVTGLQGMHKFRATNRPSSVLISPVSPIISLNQRRKAPEAH
jgi:hypothetical protein